MSAPWYSPAWSISTSPSPSTADGYFYAPDPSSQRACTIGGNVSENAGGPHTLAYGVTTNHVTGSNPCSPMAASSKPAAGADLPGYDLAGLLVGSEGTMALVTKVIVRLMRKPEAVKTILAMFDSTDDAGNTVAEITARAITPVAVEMLDGVLLRMVEEATHAGYPLDAAAVLLIELEGVTEAVEEQVEQIRAACSACHAREFRVARDQAERDLLWKGRKNAFGAVGRARPITTLRTASSRAPRSAPPCASSKASATATGWSSATSSTPATATCTRSFCSITACPASSRRSSRPATRSSITASPSAAPSPESTASAWRKTK